MLHVNLPARGWAPKRAQRAVVASGLPALFERQAKGPFGPSASALTALELLADATDLGLAAYEGLSGVVHESLQQSQPSYTLAPLGPVHRQFLASFAIVTLADAFSRKLAAFVVLEPPEDELDLDGLPELLARDVSAQDIITRVLKLTAAFVQMKFKPSEDEDAGGALAACASAFLSMARASILTFSRQSSMRPLLAALKAEDLTIAGYPYDGLDIQSIEATSSGLLPLHPKDIVGNEEYLAAGMRLARDVAGFDVELGRNPKRLNPVLFGLGRPGCGKTVTAHAVGNYFLEYCAKRNIRAKFLVIQRTDWASSYQNASASNLVRIFREEVYGFDGVCGVYWPDIDTAFASRASGALRSEEKQNLGAVFGVFDGTLLPKDGKWFMLCDANTMHMDEATVSRIAQNPMTVQGPCSAQDYAVMMRDLQLRDVAGFLDLTSEQWTQVGALCLTQNLSGRNVDAISGNIRAHIQDFEFPEAYFSADATQRQHIIQQLSRRVSVDDVLGFVQDWIDFKQDSTRAGEAQQFEQEVDSIVRRLNASEVAHRLRIGAITAQGDSSI